MWLRLRGLLHRHRIARELDDEIRFHLDQQIAENIAAGMSRDEARYAAMRTFGNPTVLKEETRDTWGWVWLEQIGQNLRQSGRALARTPGFALIAIVIIAIGIGANVSLFTVVRSVLLKPLPFRDPERLVALYERFSDSESTYNVVAGGVFTEWKKQSHSFSDLAIFNGWEEYNLSGAVGQLPERVRGTECSWNLFSTLGVEPAVGRTFAPGDDQSSANATVVLSWGLWKRRFGGDPAILNQTIHLDAKPYTVVGVMPSWFAYPEHSVQLWTPIYHELSPQRWQQLDSHQFVVVGRLDPGVTAAQATEELSIINHRLHEEHRGNPFISTAANSRPLLDDVVGDLTTPLYALLAATGCLLMIACLNVASLLVARGTAKRKELAIRAALGGSRWCLFREQLTESFLLSAAGGAVSLPIAGSVIQWFVTTRQDTARIEAIQMDGMVVGFAVGLIFLCALFAGTISAFSLRSDQILSSLQESSRSNSAGPGRVQLRKWLLSLEVALTVVLLIGAGLFVKSYARLRSFDLGCFTNNVLTMRFALPEAQYSQPAQRASLWNPLLQYVRSLPGVKAVALGDLVPGQGRSWDNGFTIAEHPPLPPGQGLDSIVRFVDPGYFQVLGIPLRRGKTFDEYQSLDDYKKTIINESFARRYFPGEDPLGKHLVTFDQKPYEIIGVVGDTRYLITKPPEPLMYFPMLYPNSATLVVRSSRDVTSLALPIQRSVKQLDPDLPVSDVLTIDQMIGKSTSDASFDATLLLAFAVLSLVLAAGGLFGVLSYIVAQRTTEIGIRVALGAQRGELLRLMLSDGLRPTAIGLVLGVAIGAAATRMIRTLLYGVQPLDAAVFTAVPIILLAVACAACLLPAWRAARLDPIQALRSE
jgi:putative ABC transport system permease protein